MKILFYRAFNGSLVSVDWIMSDRIIDHAEKYSRFTWYFFASGNRQVIIKSFNYTIADIEVDYRQSYPERYALCGQICRLLLELPCHKPLPIINSNTYPEFFI